MGWGGVGWGRRARDYNNRNETIDAANGFHEVETV